MTGLESLACVPHGHALLLSVLGQKDPRVQIQRVSLGARRQLAHRPAAQAGEEPAQARLARDALRQITEPVVVDDQRAAGLRYGQPRVQALMAAMLGFALQVCGFTNRELRERLAPSLGLCANNISVGRMTYDLRRLRLHGLIERIPKSHRYLLTKRGIITALFFTRTYARVLRSGCAQTSPPEWEGDTPLRHALNAAIEGIAGFVADAKITP